MIAGTDWRDRSPILLDNYDRFNSLLTNGLRKRDDLLNLFQYIEQIKLGIREIKGELICIDLGI